MEPFALYLIKSVIWLSSFALIFIIFLRNERFFSLNRIYLVTGLLASLLLPFFSIHYIVQINSIAGAQSSEGVSAAVQYNEVGRMQLIRSLLTIVYLSGALLVFCVSLFQSRSLVRAIKVAEKLPVGGIKLVKSHDFASSFSFFSYVFVNPSVPDIETREILNHEQAHVSQKHWFDLMLAGVLCILQWFNPFVWIYVRLIKQNHEYLADEVALQRTSDPAVYRAALLNQIAGAPVVSLSNHFNYSLNKKRFNIMKNIISSPYRKLKLLLILPVFALILYSFAKPEYRYNNAGGINAATGIDQQKEVNGSILKKDGTPLSGAIITIQGTTIGTIADSRGQFKLTGVSDDATLIVSFVGFKTKALKPVFTSVMKVKMDQETLTISGSNAGIPAPPPPPPPPPAPLDFKISDNGQVPLYVVEGKIVTEAELKKIDPETIQRIDVLKGESATKLYGDKGKDGAVVIALKSDSKSNGSSTDTGNSNGAGTSTGAGKSTGDSEMKNALVIIDGKESDVDIKSLDPNTISAVFVIKDKTAVDKYGEKGKNGVIEVVTKKADTTKSDDKNANKAPFVVVEELPEFPGGKAAMNSWIYSNLKYPAKALENKISGVVNVFFTVSSSGKITNVAVGKSANPALNDEAMRVINSMPDWKPGSQAGKPVDVNVRVPVEFKLK